MTVAAEHHERGHVYTRDAFNAQVAAAAARERTDAFWLLLASVGGGIAQLAFIAWGKIALGRHTAKALEGAAFLVYLPLVFWLLWRFVTNRRARAPRCPACDTPLQELSLSVARATGKCDRCGAQVIAG
jgi:hypothetical protein